MTIHQSHVIIAQIGQLSKHIMPNKQFQLCPFRFDIFCYTSHMPRTKNRNQTHCLMNWIRHDRFRLNFILFLFQDLSYRLKSNLFL